MENIHALVDLLTLEQLDNRIFRGQNYQAPWKRVFGGQVLGQALHAAYQTVPAGSFAHSMHGYFILAGDIDVPIIYEVDNIRDGRSFTTRRVVAIQKGRAIFNMSASFQLRQEGFDHQDLVPNVLPPDVLLPDIEQLKDLQEVSPELYKRMTRSHTHAIEFRPVEKFDPFRPRQSQANRHVWMQATEKLDVALPMHHQLLAFMSDYGLLTTAVLPHQNALIDHDLFLASLDHAIWFHRDMRVDDWLLYATDSPSASNARGFTRGRIFDQAGRLVASVAQEGLIRKIPNKS